MVIRIPSDGFSVDLELSRTVEYLHRVRRTFVAPLRRSQVESLEISIVELIDVHGSRLLGLDGIRK